MPKLSPRDIETWIATGEKLLRSPIAPAIFAAIAPFLPKAGLTAEQIAGMKSRAADAAARKERAKRRAGLA